MHELKMFGSSFKAFAAKREKWLRFFAVVIAIFMIMGTHILYSLANDSEEYVFSKTEDSIFLTLREEGYSLAGACGILGNMSVENPSFKADLYSPGGYAYGLFQWMGERIDNLKRWCNYRVLYWNRTDGQIAFAISELEGGDSIAAKINDYLKNTDNPEMAAMEFCAGFERCVGSTGRDDRDGIYEGYIYPALVGRTYQGLAVRVANARKYYDAYLLHEAKLEELKAEEDMLLNTDGLPTAGIVSEKEAAMEARLLERMHISEPPSRERIWLDRLICLGVGYLLGGILGASVLARATHKKEVFQIGEKLPTLKNVLLYLGIGPLILAMLIDIGKFYLALGASYLLVGSNLRSGIILWAGYGVILGNAYPIWRRFKGGLGITVTTVFICTYMPIWGYVCVLIGLIMAIITKSFQIGSLCIFIASVPYAFFCKGIEGGAFVTCALLIVLIRHYKFIKKYIGKELLRKHRQRNKRRRAATT